MPFEPAVSVEAAYETLFATHFTSLVRLAGLLGAEDPEDVAQEAFVRLHAHRATLRDPAAAPAWLTRAVERAEHRAAAAALDMLTARQRRVLVLRYWLDLPLAEIAATLGVPLGTVKSNHSRGLAAGPPPGGPVNAENALRAALHARSGDFVPSPGAWATNQARVRRRVRARRVTVADRAAARVPRSGPAGHGAGGGAGARRAVRRGVPGSGPGTARRRARRAGEGLPAHLRPAVEPRPRPDLRPRRRAARGGAASEVLGDARVAGRRALGHPRAAVARVPGVG